MAESRSKAATLIDAGAVLVGGSVADRAARMVAPDEPVTVLGPPPRYVSRGGDKLDAALRHFTIPVSGARALDAGASTGGFTDCLLQHGAASVVSVDVGRAQMHERMRSDHRVTVMERTNIRDLSANDLGEKFPVIVVDLSFISLRTVASGLVGLACPGADIVALVKPQFEAGRAEASRGRGVISDPSVWRRVLAEVITAFEDAGATMMGIMVSPLRGADGNVEFLAHLRTPRPAATGSTGRVDVASELDLVVAVAAGET